MAAGSTYEKIATTTLGSSQATLTFTSISGSYTDLVLIVNGTMAASSNINIWFNGSTSNRSSTRLIGDGSGASSSRYNSTCIAGFYSSNNTTGVFNIYNYSNTTTYKTYISRNNGDYVICDIGSWASTAAITELSIAGDSGKNWQSGSTFTLYGIAAA